MKADPSILCIAAAALLAACTSETAGNTGAESAATGSQQKCFGVARAGRNDCAANGHACAGQAKNDADAAEWLYLPEGTCRRIVNGRSAGDEPDSA